MALMLVAGAVIGGYEVLFGLQPARKADIGVDGASLRNRSV
jgi:hypothetical protein